ncbi:MAG: hypothetical protein ABIJ05_05140 [Patescibacteria group bacterium]
MNKFPNSKQTVESTNCGPFCLLNIYTHFQIPTTINKIQSELNVSKDDPTYLAQLARNCLKHKLDSIILSSNPRIISPSWKDKTKKEIIVKLKEWVTLNNSNSWWLRTALFLLFYLQEGGNIKIVDLSTSIIDKYLEKGYLLLCCLDESWLWGKRKINKKAEYDDIKGYSTGHCIVIYKHINNDYFISDPYPTKIEEKEGLYKVNKQQLLVSTLAWSQEILAIKKTKAR